MRRVGVRLGDATLAAIDRVVRVDDRKRADFIRSAVKDAVFRAEQERMHKAYRIQPDSAPDAGLWDLPEEWNG
jgi:metal-responsive CopG/Arc/MetJ family transcriptional regulator